MREPCKKRLWLAIREITMLFNRRRLIFLIAAITIGALGLILFAINLQHYNSEQKIKPHKATQCPYQESSEIPNKRKYPINNSINPCVNFYGYACSNVIDNFKLREDALGTYLLLTMSWKRIPPRFQIINATNCKKLYTCK